MKIVYSVVTQRCSLSVKYIALIAIVLITIMGLALPALFAHAAVAVTTDDWPTSLHDPLRTSASNDTTFSTSNVAQLVKVWSFQTGGVVASSPTITGGTAYFGSWDGYEYALDATTGAQKWKTYLGITNGYAYCNPASAGVSSAATVQNNVVYLGGGDDYWYALDATTGTILWKVYTGDNAAAGGHYNWSSPLIYNGYAYIGIASFGDCPLVQGQLLKVNLGSHQVEANLSLVPDGQVGGGIWTSPSIDSVTNTIFVATGTESATTQVYAQSIVAIDVATLAVKSFWHLPEAEAINDSDFGTSVTLFTDGNGNQLASATNKNGYVYAFNRNNLAAGPVWQTLIALGGQCPVPCGQGTVSSAASGNGKLYVAGEDTVINGVGYRGSVNALDPATGHILWQHGTTGPVIGAVTYANGLVIDGAGSTLEVLDASTGKRLASYTTSGWLYAAPSVANGKIYTGGVDANVYAFGLPATPPLPPPPDPNCPATWICQDIGNPLPAGSEKVTNGTWNVNAGGTGFTGNTDQFRFLSQNVSGDVQIVADTLSQQTTSNQAMPGLMIRQSSDPASPYYAVFYTSSSTIVVAYRTKFGAITTQAISLSASALPQYLEIQRIGDQFQAATSPNGAGYTLVPGSTVTLALPDTVQAGMAVSSGVSGAADSVAYSNVSNSAPTTLPDPTPAASACPTSWFCQDIGDPGVVGDQSLLNGLWTLKGAGQGITGYADQFHSVWQPSTGNVVLSARLVTQTNTSDGTLAGIMLRQDTRANTPYYAVLVSPTKGLQIQVRFPDSPDAVILTTIAGAAPAYLKIVRYGNTFSTYTSTDGVTWTYVLATSLNMVLPNILLAGMAVTVGLATAISTATFDTVNISANAPVPPTICPINWSCNDIGYPTPAGEQIVNAGTWTVSSGGSDIWNTNDEFRYVSQSFSGDGNVSARVTSQTNTSAYAKAGVMIRQSTDPGAVNYGVFVTPGNGILIQYRATALSATSLVVGVADVVPQYLKIGKVGNAFTAYLSPDGTNWTAVAGSTVNLTMTGTLMAGIAVTSHNSTQLSTVTFDTVTVGASATCPTNWNCADIGAPVLAGNQTLNGNIWTMQAAGGDIWGTDDQFHYIWQGLATDGSISAHVVSQTNTNPWAKAGVMLRQSIDPGSVYYNVVVTPGNGITVQYRTTAGASAATAASLAGTVPNYLQVSKAGTVFTAYTSPDGITWTALAGSSVTLNMTGTILVGVAATSHDTGTFSSVTFDTVTVGASAACPTNWNCADVGAPVLAGNQMLNGNTWTMQAAGGDIWGTNDQFHYIWQGLATDGSISAHVVSQTNTNAWAKAGIMLRQSTDPSSAYYNVVVTPGNGITVQYRTTTGASAATAVSLAGTVPQYLQVSKVGMTYTAYTSLDGITWTVLAGSSVTLNMTGTVLAGVAATSHDTGTLGTIVFDSVNIGSATNFCPTHWNCADIGNQPLAGSQVFNAGTWIMQGSGGDIWGTNDQFRYVWQALNADGSVSAHVVSQTNTDPWAKAGVMLRQSTNPGSAYYALVLTPSNGIAVQYRATGGGVATNAVTISGTTPAYLKVNRVGTTFTAYTSSDGLTWTALAGSSVTLNMAGTLDAGIVDTSHDNGQLSSVVFDTVVQGMP